MQYTIEIEINLPRDQVVALFDSTENLFKWLEGLQSFEHISGEPGHPGAKSKIVMQSGKRTYEMIETVTVRNLPEEFSGTYDAKGVHNIVRNHLIDLGNGRTKWVTENEFLFKGIFMRIIGFLMKGAFVKQSRKYMLDFKAFAEEGRDVNAANAA